MLHFQTVRTARFSFKLQELSLGNIKALYDIHPRYLERARSAFLRYALAEFQWNKGFEQYTLDDLTAQERLFIEACYLSSVSDEADFRIANGRYTDYLQVEKQYRHAQIELGRIPDDEDDWFMQPLTGLMLESIEERVFAKAQVERIDVVVYAMAAQLFRKGEELPDIKADFVKFGDWLDERVEKFYALPESAFIALISMFFSGQEQLTHLFAINFDEDGIHITANKAAQDKQGGMEALLPCRFRFAAKFTAITQKLFGKSEQDE